MAKATSFAIPSTPPRKADGVVTAVKNAVERSLPPMDHLTIAFISPDLCSMKSIYMGVHGIAISAVARIKRMAWGTFARWLELAARYAERFNRRRLRGFILHELQSDEIRTFVGDKKQVVWVLTTLEAWSRLWVFVMVGGRTFRNIKTGILNTIQRGHIKHRFLFTSDDQSSCQLFQYQLPAC
jgi:hypothetical protein